MDKLYDLIILGAGPAGLSAGIYAQRAKLEALLLEKDYVQGGQVINTYEVENYPGLPGKSGMELAEAFKSHANELKLSTARAEIKRILREGNKFILDTGKDSYEAKTVIIATGARHRKLGVSGEEKLAGMGVSYCATCDGAFFKDKIVAVIGGGDVALEDAIFLARGSKKVYVIHRRDEFRGAPILQERLMSMDNVEILWDTVVDEIVGEDVVTGLNLHNVKSEEKSSIEVDGVFIAVGISPNTENFQGFLEMDKGKYIVAGENCCTSVPGIFAAGDVRTKPLRQIVTAAADGAVAVTSAQNYLVRL